MISDLPAYSAPTRTKAGWKWLASSATITTLRWPVLMTASVGIIRTCSFGAPSRCTEANMPGRRRLSWFWTTTRSLRVRVAVLSSG